MVGRLVKSKKVIWLQDKLCHSQTGSLTTTEHSNLFVYIFTLEQEGSKNIPEFKTDITDCNTVQSTENRILLIKYIFLILSILSDIDIISHSGISSHRIEFVHDYAHQRSLSFSVSADKSDLLTTTDLYLSV